MLTQEENLAGLAAINRELIARAEKIDAPQQVLLDMDSTEIPVYGEQEQSAYNGHFDSACYHPPVAVQPCGRLSSREERFINNEAREGEVFEKSLRAAAVPGGKGP